MSHWLKVTLFVLGFGIIACAALAKIFIDGISLQCYARFGIFGKVRSFDSFSKQVSRLNQVDVRDKPVVREGEESGKRNCCSQDVLFG
jgi:hypothetical protein